MRLRWSGDDSPSCFANAPVGRADRPYKGDQAQYQSVLESWEHDGVVPGKGRDADGFPIRSLSALDNFHDGATASPDSRWLGVLHEYAGFLLRAAVARGGENEGSGIFPTTT